MRRSAQPLRHCYNCARRLDAALPHATQTQRAAGWSTSRSTAECSPPGQRLPGLQQRDGGPMAAVVPRTGPGIGPGRPVEASQSSTTPPTLHRYLKQDTEALDAAAEPMPDTARRSTVAISGLNNQNRSTLAGAQPRSLRVVASARRQAKLRGDLPAVVRATAEWERLWGSPPMVLACMPSLSERV